MLDSLLVVTLRLLNTSNSGGLLLVMLDWLLLIILDWLLLITLDWLLLAVLGSRLVVILESLNTGDGEGLYSLRQQFWYFITAMPGSNFVFFFYIFPFLRLLYCISEALLQRYFLYGWLYDGVSVEGLLLVRGELSDICPLVGGVLLLEDLVVLYCIKR